MAMHYHIEIRPKTLYFKKPAGTSRGTYTERKSWYIYLTAEETPGRQGIGECAPLPKLSCDDVPGYEEVLAKACQNFTRTGRIDVDCAIIHLSCSVWRLLSATLKPAPLPCGTLLSRMARWVFLSTD